MTVSPGRLPDDDPRGHLLASDADREATVELLRVAATDGRLTMDEMSDRSELAYRARTSGELAALTRDLRERSEGSLPVTVAAQEKADSYIAIFSGTDRKGHWRVPRRSHAVAIFGGIELDLREAELAAQDCSINAVSIFSGISITVPPGVAVHLTGIAVFGAKAANVPAAPPGAPVLHVRCSAVFGAVEVKVAQPPGAVDALPRPPLE